MSAQFFSRLSQNFINILEDNEYYDITIEVGKDPKVKIFRAHNIILNNRSTYFRRKSSTNKKYSNDLVHIKLPNISPNIFQIILKYMYGGILFLDRIEPPDMINLLVAAESLNLQEIVDYLQSYLIKNNSNWMEENFTFVHDTTFQHDSFIELQKFCTDIMSKYPEKIFKSLDFTSIPENSLITLIKRDDLKMEEIDVWEHVLKWGLAQNPTLLQDPEAWSNNDFKLMENTLHNCLPHVRFFQLSSKEFLEKVIPYKNLLKVQLYENLNKHYLDDNSKIILKAQQARGSTIDSKLITNKIAAYIASWIDRKENEHPLYGFQPYNPLNNPYKFKLLLRGSRDGFDAQTFHKLCDKKPKTVTIVKVKGTNEILGGYNPLTWEYNNYNEDWSNSGYLNTNESFIFSFTFMNLKDVILSRVKNSSYAIKSDENYGPCFGDDFYIDNNRGHFGKTHYEKNISRNIPESGNKYFRIEEYEVFQTENQ